MFKFSAQLSCSCRRTASVTPSARFSTSPSSFDPNVDSSSIPSPPSTSSTPSPVTRPINEVKPSSLAERLKERYKQRGGSELDWHGQNTAATSTKAGRQLSRKDTKKKKLRTIKPEEGALWDAWHTLPPEERQAFYHQEWSFRSGPITPWEDLSEANKKRAFHLVRQRYHSSIKKSQTKRIQAEAATLDPAQDQLEKPYHPPVREDAASTWQRQVKQRLSRIADFVKLATAVKDSLSAPAEAEIEAKASDEVLASRQKDIPPHCKISDNGGRQVAPHLDLQREQEARYEERAPRFKTSMPRMARSNSPPLSSFPHQLSSSLPPPTPLVPNLPQPPIATLAHGLSRVLYNPGVHFLSDPRSKVYNFSPSLESLPQPEEFDFEKLPEYVTSSKDEALMELAEREGKTFVGSTSTTVGMLCQIYFWLSRGKRPNFDMLSSRWQTAQQDFGMGQKMPVSIILHEKDGRYAIDSDKSFDAGSDTNILASLGHLMEKLLTTEEKEFSRFLHGSTDPAPSEAKSRQAYHYVSTEHMVLRSQLDATDPHLPRKTFDVKTRGTVAVRQDRLNYVQASGYHIDRLQGEHHSFEREYYDLIRSAFLKYSFQARIGHMDGCFVAYHSTSRFFGFQYVSLEEMYEALYGNAAEGEHVFRLCIGFMEKLLLEMKDSYPGESVAATFAAQDDVLRVFVEPLVSSHPRRVTLLEVRGINYVDEEAVGQVSIVPTEEILEGRAMPRTPRWDVGYNIQRYSTTDGRHPKSKGFLNILSMLKAIRTQQKRFNEITLPDGVTTADLKAAAKEASQAGKDAEKPELLKKFPLNKGMKYRDQPSYLVQQLRLLAVEGDKKRRAALLRNAERDIVQMQSKLVKKE